MTCSFFVPVSARVNNPQLCDVRRCHVQVCTAKMNLGDEVDLEDYVSRPDKISAADVCWPGAYMPDFLYIFN